MHGAATAATNTLRLCLLTTQSSLHCQEKKRSFEQRCLGSLQVWEDVLQQMPARAEIVSQLGQSAEVQILYSASRLPADMSVSACGPCFSRDSISLQSGLFAEYQCTTSSTRLGLFPLWNMWFHA